MKQVGCAAPTALQKIVWDDEYPEKRVMSFRKFVHSWASEYEMSVSKIVIIHN
jgi:hypothetical protein